MKFRSLSTALLIVFCYLISQCAKDAVETIPTFSPGCYPSKLVKNADTIGFVYNKSGQLTSIVGKFEPLKIYYTNSGFQSSISNSKQKILFTYNQLNQLTEVYTEYKIMLSENRWYSYNDAGQINNMYFRTQSGKTLLYDFKYSNVTDTNPSRIITPDYFADYEYDNQKTPIADLKGVIYTELYYNDFIFREENNIKKITVRSPNSDLISETTFEYEYNEKGFPTKVTTITSYLNYPTYTETYYYIYECFE